MELRTLATGLAVNRILFGVNFVAAPAQAGRSWIGGPAARRPATGVFGRALGARDLALGLGALYALRAGDDEARRWMAAHAIPTASTWWRRSPRATRSRPGRRRSRC